MRALTPLSTGTSNLCWKKKNTARNTVIWSENTLVALLAKLLSLVTLFAELLATRHQEQQLHTPDPNRLITRSDALGQLHCSTLLVLPESRHQKRQAKLPSRTHPALSRLRCTFKPTVSLGPIFNPNLLNPPLRSSEHSTHILNFLHSKPSLSHRPSMYIQR